MSSALVPGSWRTPSADRRAAVEGAATGRSCCAPSSTRATSRSRTMPGEGPWLPPRVALMMMLPNCSGSTSRPERGHRRLKYRPDSAGCCPTRPATDSTFWPATVGDLAGGDVARGQLLRVEPGPDAVVALTQVGDVRDAGDPQQLILDVDRGEVTQVDVVVSPVGRDEVDEHQQVGRLLLDGEALSLHRPAAVAAWPAKRGSAPSPAPCSGPCRGRT